jgi:hypothetical protein
LLPDLIVIVLRIAQIVETSFSPSRVYSRLFPASFLVSLGDLFFQRVNEGEVIPSALWLSEIIVSWIAGFLDLELELDCRT